jgi:hypothetical protein
MFHPRVELGRHHEEMAMSALLQVIVASSQLLLVADNVPDLKYEPACRAAVEAAAIHNRSENACLADEKAARAKLQQEWKTFTPEQRSHCVRLSTTGGMPSYVELLTCVEMSKAAANLPAAAKIKPKIER